MTDGPRVPSVDEAVEYLARFNFFERYVHGPEEGRAYVGVHARRFVETLRRLPPFPVHPRVLELGAVPYSMTILLRRYRLAEVDTYSFYEVEEGPKTHVLESPDGLERYRFEYRPINIERDPFPSADGSYDLVLCCEVLEHVLINPSHMFFEAHRALKPGGFLVVTTPNVARAQNIKALAEGRNIYDAYHGNGIYGRHNREYTAAEVRALLESCGFDLVSHETLDVYSVTEPGSAPGQEDTIMTVAQSTRPRRMGAPPGLYVLMEEYRNVIRPAITMGIDEIGHLGRGWYDQEHDGDLTVRWMCGQAACHLKTDRARFIGVSFQAHHPDLRARPIRVSLTLGGCPLGQVFVSDHAWQSLEFEMPETTGVVDVGISVDREWVPHESLGSSDRRRLGLRIQRCWSR
jgi:SAM-dependent methyltransferase